MTLNLTEQEMAVLEGLSKQKDLSKTVVMRQALRLYQLVDARLAQDLFALYRLPELNLWVLAFQVDGEWVRTFEHWPNLRDVAAALREMMTGAGTAYIPSGSLRDSRESLEREIRSW